MVSGWTYEVRSDGEVEAWYRSPTGAAVRLWVEQESHPRIEPPPPNCDQLTAGLDARSCAREHSVTVADVYRLMQPVAAAHWIGYAADGTPTTSSAVVVRRSESPRRRLVPLDVRAAATEALTEMHQAGMLGPGEWLRHPPPRESEMSQAGGR